MNKETKSAGFIENTMKQCFFCVKIWKILVRMIKKYQIQLKYNKNNLKNY